MSRIFSKEKYPWYMRLLFYFQRKKFGKVLEPAKVWGKTPQVYLGFLAMYNRLNRKKGALDPQLSALVTVRVSQVNHCAFCVDMNSYLLLERGGSLKKLNALENYENSLLFSGKEKVALAFTDAITYSDRSVDDALFQQLKTFYNEDEIVELTALISFQNMSSKFNAALQIPSQGICKI
jgi:AhpD family alkylhydroperoxidase